MLDLFCLGVALAVGQGQPAPAVPMPPSAQAGRATIGSDPPARIPAALPTVGVPNSPTAQPTPTAPPPPADAKPTAPDKKDDTGKSGDKKEDEKKEDEKKPEEKGYFMKMLEGTALGCQLEACKVKVSGWVDMSYNCSSDHRTNVPVAWDDRANRFLLNQTWVDIERPIDTDSKEVDVGWKVSLLYGSDYRWTLIRGFLNNQLKNQTIDPREPNGFEQNLYGFDIPQFYANAWLPGVAGDGTEVAVGRFLSPIGYESIMATGTPFLSRSYAFQWAPPFFNTGVMFAPKFDKNNSAKLMFVNGNDVFFDGSQEWRFVGSYTTQTDDGNTSLTLATSLGRGKFNPARQNGPLQGVTTFGLAYEPFGRNNFNVFDVVFTQKYNDTLSSAFEFIYGYEQDVPAIATGSARNFNGTSGTSDWLSLVKYYFVDFDERTRGQVRLEAFYDGAGERTGFEGWYYAATLGAVLKPNDCTIFRPEIRYDYNGYSRPFEGKHGLFTAAADLIFKF